MNFCLFDGYVTDAQILDHDGGRNRLSVTASDRIYILKTDCRQGPNTNTTANMARGWQWWMQGADIRNGAEVAVLRRRAKLLVAVGYFPTPFSAEQRKSFIDWAQSCRTRQVNSKYQFEIDRTAYISSKRRPEENTVFRGAVSSMDD